MKQINYLLIILLFTFVSTTLLASNASDDPTGKDDPKVSHLYDDIDLVPTIKFDYAKKVMIKSVFPQLEANGEEEAPAGINDFNAAVTEIVQGEIHAYKDKVKDLQPLQLTFTQTSVKNDLYIDYDTSAFRATEDDHLISIRFTIQGFITGMAHPYHTYRVLNYDLDANQSIELSSLFDTDSNYLGLIADYARDVLIKRLRDSSLVISGTAPLPMNYQNWNLKAKGLLITFNEGQVAPYVYGVQSVLIPYDALRSVIAKDSPIASCIHGRKCFHDNILTGGFIDEAVNTLHRGFNPGFHQV
jgi:hypothetical protein